MPVYPTGIKGATDLIGGGDGAVDKIPTVDLDDLDGVIAITDDGAYVYSVDPTSAEDENSPYIIKPDDEVDDKRLILQRFSESAFEVGTASLFGLSTAPTGWTKKTDWQDNAMLCYATGDISNGGAVNPQSVHAHGDNLSIDNHTVSIAQMPSHDHTYTVCYPSTPNGWPAGSTLICGTYNSNSTGGGGGHNHGVSGGVSNNNAPHYQEVIAATKD